MIARPWEDPVTECAVNGGPRWLRRYGTATDLYPRLSGPNLTDDFFNWLALEGWRIARPSGFSVSSIESLEKLRDARLTAQLHGRAMKK